MKAETAMGQAWQTALEYFDPIYKHILEQCSEASPDAKLKAAVELAKVAAMDYYSATTGGLIEDTLQSNKLLFGDSDD